MKDLGAKQRDNSLFFFLLLAHSSTFRAQTMKAPEGNLGVLLPPARITTCKEGIQTTESFLPLKMLPPE